MQTTDLDSFFAMLQDRARDIKMRNISLKRDRVFELFKKLPREIAMNIFSRLPIRIIIICKLVCKAWLDLIECREFSNHLILSKPDHLSCLVAFPYANTLITRSSKPVDYPWPYKIEKLSNIDNYPMDVVHMGLSGSLPLARSSVNGLILLLHRECNEQQQRLVLWVCNPITREYVRVPNPPGVDFGLELLVPLVNVRLLSCGWPGKVVLYNKPSGNNNYNFGFGVSRTSKQYKVVWISQSECRVYDLGLGAMGQWRSIAIPGGGGGLEYNKWNMECAFVDGNLYWLDPPQTLTLTLTLTRNIACFDLETEVFTRLSAPSTRGDLNRGCHRSLCALDDCLCLCDVYGDEIEIWLMKGREWSKKLVIDGKCDGIRTHGYLSPIKVLEDGGNGMLLLGRRADTIFQYSDNNHFDTIFYYSNNNRARGGGRPITRVYPPAWATRTTIIGCVNYQCMAIYSPSFLPLRTLLVDEDVLSF